MLVLSRKKNEKIMIGDGVTVVVVEIRGDKVRLGIDAPPEVPVHRQEVYEAIQRQGAGYKEPSECTCYELAGGAHQMGCPYYGKKVNK